MSEPMLRLLSLGAGVQSTALALLATDGTLPVLDGAIFADTGWEPAAVYAHLARSAEWAARQTDLLEELADQDAAVAVLEDGDPDGCSPYGCRSGLPVALPDRLPAESTPAPARHPHRSTPHDRHPAWLPPPPRHPQPV